VWMEWVLKHIEKPGERAIRLAHESSRSFVHECWQLGSQWTSTVSYMALRFLNQPDVQQELLEKRIRPVPHHGAGEAEPESESPFLALVPTDGRRASLDPFAMSSYEGKSILGNKLRGQFAAAPYAWHMAPSDAGDGAGLAEAEQRRRKREKKERKRKKQRRWRSHSLQDSRPDLAGDEQSNSGEAEMFRSSSDSELHERFDELDSFGDSEVGFERTTGLLEDIRITILQVIDWSCDTCLAVWRSIFAMIVGFSVLSVFSLSIVLAPFRLARFAYVWLTTLISQVYGVVSSALLDPSTTITPGIDRRTKEQIVTEAGYPYGCYEVTTDDGYILQLERLPNPGSRKVLYFQHGIIDNAFTWVAGGAQSSVAMMAYDRGYDVFLGNFRGNEPVKHADPKIRKKDYWDFNVNHHAFSDMKAFVEHIHALKQEELDVPPDVPKGSHYEVSIIAHSMGGMAAMMYMINARSKGQDHGLSKAILLAPAGIHRDSPWLARAVPPVLDRLLRCMPCVYSLGFPSAFVRSLTVKVFEDVKSTNPTRDLFTYFATTLIGGDVQGHSLTRVHNLVQWVFAGTPVGVFRHFRQLISSKQFRVCPLPPHTHYAHRFRISADSAGVRLREGGKRARVRHDGTSALHGPLRPH